MKIPEKAEEIKMGKNLEELENKKDKTPEECKIIEKNSPKLKIIEAKNPENLIKSSKSWKMIQSLKKRI